MYTANFTYEYRLVNGSTPYNGRLEIRRDDGPWGTVRSCTWYSIQTAVACSQLGFSRSALPPSIIYGASLATGPAHITITQCERDVKSLIECQHTVWDDPKYINDHGCDVEISCMPGKSWCAERSIWMDSQICLFGLVIHHVFLHTACCFG